MIALKDLLDSSRRELLDLSNRNRLLSMPVESKSARMVHIRDERSDDIYRLLVTEKKSFTFSAGQADDDPISLMGVSIDNDNSPAARHVDSKLQTSLTPDGLMKRLLSLYRDARTIEEEQGVNILYLALGRLKWFEAESSDTPRYAPLILVPVQLQRSSASDRFSLTWREEEAQENLSLAAKLKDEFNISLPPFPAEDELVPSRYSAAVARAVSGQPRWEAQCDAILLGFFSFAKLLMYRDLDAKNWPNPEQLLENPTLSGLLRDGFSAADSPFPDDANIDDLIPATRLDHVVDADSSQTLSIEIVRRGSSVVIQGPPGTGKSQSITNLIAAAVLDGKKVLFVAEKLAALEVVKRRLEAVGLGVFCLVLHSQKSKKRLVLEEIGRTWDLGQPRGQNLESVVGRLEATRQQLNGHAAMLHTRLEPSGATPFRIMGALAELGERGKEPGGFDFPEAALWDMEDVRERRALLSEMAQRIEQMGLPCAHPWRGAERETVLNIDLPSINSAIENLASGLPSLRASARNLAGLLQQSEPVDIDQVESLHRLITHIATAPPLDCAALQHNVWDGSLVGLIDLVQHGQEFEELRKKLVACVSTPAVASAAKQELNETVVKVASLVETMSKLQLISKRFSALIRLPEPITLADVNVLHNVGAHLSAVPPLDRVALQNSVWNNALDDLRALLQNGQDFEALRQKIEVSVSEPGVASAAIETLIESQTKVSALTKGLTSLSAITGRIAQLLKLPEPEDFLRTDSLRRKAVHLLSVPRFDLKAVGNPAWDDQLHEVRRLVEHGMVHAALRNQLSALVMDSAWEIDLTFIRTSIAAHISSPLRFFNGDFRKSMTALRGVIRGTPPTTRVAVLSLLDNLLSERKHGMKLREGEALGRNAFGASWRGEDSDWDLLSAVVAWSEEAATAGITPETRKAFVEIDSTEFAQLVKELGMSLTEAWRSVQSLKDVLTLTFGVQGGDKALARTGFSPLSEQLIQWQDRLHHLQTIQRDVSEWNSLSAWAGWLCGMDQNHYPNPLLHRDPVAAVATTIDADLKACKALHLSICEKAEFGRQAFGSLWSDADSNWKQLTAVVLWIEAESKVAVSPATRKVFAGLDSLDEFSALSADLNHRYGEVRQAIQAVKDERALDFGGEAEAEILAMTEFTKINERLVSWLDWLNHLLAIQHEVSSCWESLSAWAGWICGEDQKGFPSSLRHSEPVAATSSSITADLSFGQELHLTIGQGNELGQQAFGTVWHGDKTDWEQCEAILQWMQAEGFAYQSVDFRRIFGLLDPNHDFGKSARQLGEGMNLVRTAAIGIQTAVGLNLPTAFGCEVWEAVPFVALEDRLSEWRNNLEDLTHWNTWFLRARRARELHLGSVVDAMETGRLPGSAVRDVFDRTYHSQLLREAAKTFPELAQFDGLMHQRAVEEFRSADLTRLSLAKYRVLTTHHQMMPARNAGLGATGILLGEMARKRGHRPVRKLLKDTGSVVQDIKPVFMMSPLSVAQYLEPGAVEFDLLIIDEASQVEPVDALGAFARTKQQVVVGDSKQLPPTRFFAHLTSNDDDDEDEFSEEEMPTAQAKDVESILGLCLARGLRETMLRWHYRSRHHSLIAVSNREFYENKLFIVPSPYLAESEFGLRTRFVAGGVYDRGGTSTNRVEANAVCRAVLEHARLHPDLSLGVAAFSVKQQQVILDELELLRRANPDLEEFYHAHPHEPFFVKNLESVQGDERDAIFISVGYGPNTKGYMAMNFGPLSNEGGERRLNVLISRAKRRCEVFVSFHAVDIDTARVSGRGVHAFKTFLQYAETGQLGVAERTDREEDSPFEIAVRRAVESLGYEVHPQVGVAGFFIDLGVVDPAKPGRYLMGIECDGATYHSSRSARDRDRLRQAVLEDHGWIIHRVWSTDWFQRPGEQLRKIGAALEQAKLTVLGISPTSIVTALGPDDVDIDREGVQPAPDARAALSVPYEESQFQVNSWEAPHELSPQEMADVLLRVVEIEGPVHVDELVARVRDLWSLGRAGSRIQASVQSGVALLVSSKDCQREDNCLFFPEIPVRVRNRENVRSASLRKPELLPPQEIRAAIEAVITAHHGAAEEELIVAVVRLLGFKATSATLREVIGKQVRFLEAQNRLISQDGMLRIKGT